MDEKARGWQSHIFRLRRVTQVIADFSRKPWTEIRILDLGSLEGQYSLEFAARGAQVVAIEGREENNAKARAAATSLNLSGIEFITDDVRNLSLERYGKFDVVLCSGILYHLPGEDACRLIQTISEVCDHLTIIDTHVGLVDSKTIVWEGKKYGGAVFQEHASADSDAVKLARVWSSLDNENSFWMTKPSLMNLLRDTGFTTVTEVFRPVSFFDYSDRLTFVAIKGTRERVSVALEAPEQDYPEHLDLPAHPGQAPQLAPAPSSSSPTWKRMARRVRRVLLGR
jgi:SAM-dependent methyltransferase